MKKMILCALMFVSLMVTAAWGVSVESVAIDSTNFPDDAFREYVRVSFDRNNDGMLGLTERTVYAPTIEVPNKGIKSLEGIEHFTMVTRLYCSGNELQELDVSKNSRLQFLICDSNDISELDLSNNSMLTGLSCTDNRLTALDLTNNTSLTILGCNYNNLTALDLTNNTSLTSLGCIHNQLTSLNISNNPRLDYIQCSYNQLTSLDVSCNSRLTELICGFNQLTALDLTNNTSLTKLLCGFNKITALDLSNNPELSYLECRSNDLTSLDVSGCNELTLLNCSDNQLTELDVSRNTALTELRCSGNELTALNVRNNTLLTTLYCRENALSALDLSKNAALVTLFCMDNELTKLDISQNTALVTLHCGDNLLTELDVSNNTALATLDFQNSNEITREIGHGNKITKIDVTANEALTSLSGSYNQLSAIDVSKNTSLTLLNVPVNQLTELDLSANTALTMLYCAGNKLTALNLSKNTALTYVSCESNQLAELDISGCTKLGTLICWANELKTLDVSGSPKMTLLYCNKNQLTELDLSKNLSLDVENERFRIGYQKNPAINIMRPAGETSSSYPYSLNFSEYMNAGNITSIIASSVKASDENGEDIEVSYANGIARFSTIPEVISYSCYTGLGSVSLDVKIGEASYLTVTQNNHVYRLFTKGDTWINAKDYCESVGGHLMTTTTTDEIDLAEGLLSKAFDERDIDSRSCWLGARWEDDGEGYLVFHWVTSEDYYIGESIDFDGGGNLAVKIDSSNNRLTLRGNNIAIPFICEWEPKTASFTQVDPLYQLWSDDPKAYYSGDVSYGEIPSPLSLYHLSENPPARDRANDYNPPEYDPRSNTLMPSVKVQSPYGTCWSFASLGALEASYAAQYGEKAPDLSELHQAWYAYMDPRAYYRTERRATDPGEDPVLDQGGNYLMSIYFLSGAGAASESDLPYTAASVEALRAGKAKYEYPEKYPHPLMLREAYTLGEINAANRDDVKYLTKKYGALRVGLVYSDSGYNAQNNSYYLPNTNRTNHAIQLVGWDDNYSRENFTIKPASNGAWLMRNSWGENWGDKGYFWVSYEQYIASSAVYIADKASVGTVYGRGATNPNHSVAYEWSAGMFHSTGNDTIKEVAFYTRDNNMPYEVYINKHGTTKPANPGVPGEPSVTGTMLYAGYHTVPLDQYVAVEPGEYFSVIVKLGAGSTYGVYSSVEKSETESTNEVTLAGKSYFAKGSDKPGISSWIDAGSISGGVYNATIKAFTASFNSAVIDAPSITTSSLSAGTVGQAYSQTLTASGNAFVTWYANRLPDGLSVEGSTITGTPTTAGTYSVEIIADSSAGTAKKTLELVINALPGTDTPGNDSPGNDSPGTDSPISNNTSDSSGGGGCSSLPAFMAVLLLSFTLRKKY